MTVPAYRRYMTDKIRRYHASYLGWITNYDDYQSRGPGWRGRDCKEVFGYRFVLDFAGYPLAVQPGAEFTVKLTVHNTGSAPFYLDWPVAVALLDPATKKPVWSAPLNGVDIRRWAAGRGLGQCRLRLSPSCCPVSGGRPCRTASRDIASRANTSWPLPSSTDRAGCCPASRFAIENYFRGGWHPLGFIGVGGPPEEAALHDVKFDSPAFDDSLHYKVPEKLLAVKTPALPRVKAVTPWKSDPNVELINPHRYWILETRDHGTEKQILSDGPGGGRVIRVTGDFGDGTSLSHTFGGGAKLDRGRYRFALRVRGTPGQAVEFEVADGTRKLATGAQISLSEGWQEHIIEFEIKTEFKDETALRFRLPREVKGTFDLGDPRLKTVR